MCSASCFVVVFCFVFSKYHIKNRVKHSSHKDQCNHMCILVYETLSHKINTATELPIDIRKILILKTIACPYLLLIRVFLKKVVRVILNRWQLVCSILHLFTTATQLYHSLIFHRLPVAQQLNYTHTHSEARTAVKPKIKLKCTVPSLLTKLSYKTVRKINI